MSEVFTFYQIVNGFYRMAQRVNLQTMKMNLASCHKTHYGLFGNIRNDNNNNKIGDLW